MMSDEVKVAAPPAAQAVDLDAVREYIEARTEYEMAEGGGGFWLPRPLSYSNPVALRYREARAALSGLIDQQAGKGVRHG